MRDEIAVPGRVVVEAKSDEFWGGGRSEDFASEVLENPTWEELTKVLDEQMKVTKDYHHQFLEGIYSNCWLSYDEETGDGVKVVRLILGS